MAEGDGTPTFRDISIRGLTLGEVKQVAVIEGLLERFIRAVRLHDVVATRARSGIICTRAADVTIDGLGTESLESPAIAARAVERLEVRGLTCPRPKPNLPLVQLEEVSGAFVHGCSAGPGPPRLVHLTGPHNRGVVVTGNNLPAGTAPVGDPDSGRG